MHVPSTHPLTPDATAATTRSIWWSVLALLLLAVGVRLINLDGLPRIDELYTVMAARGWLEHGVPRVGDGMYERAELYTVLVAQFFRVLGDGLVAARLPGVIASSLLVVAVFLWVRAVSSLPAAWVAALFVALDPLSIQEAQFARFYALHALLFWLAAIGLFALAEQRPTLAARLAVALGSGAALLLALHLQPTTLMGAVGLALWLVVVGPAWLFSGPERRWRWYGLAALAALGLVVVAGLMHSGYGAELWDRYRWTPLHAEAVRNQVWYYHLLQIERYPSLWPLLPFTVLLALAAAPRPALFCTIVFATVFVLLSFGGMKHLNYLYFVYPFLFVLWALALVHAFRALRALAANAAAGTLRQLAPTLATRRAPVVLIATGLAFLVLANGATARLFLKPLGIRLTADESAIDWAPAAAALAPRLPRAAVVLTPNDLFALYYLGRYDVAVSPNRLSEQGAEEFALDRRTGRPVIASPASLALILDCYPSGLVVVDDTMYRQSWALTDAMADLLERRTTPLAVTPGVRAFVWEQPPGDPAACAALPDSLPPPAGGRTG